MEGDGDVSGRKFETLDMLTEEPCDYGIKLKEANIMNKICV